MDSSHARLLLRLNAGFNFLLGGLLVLSTWDGFYEKLDLTKPSPALLTQLGGIAIAALGYLLWVAASVPALRRPVATVAAAANAAATLTTALWLFFRGERDLEVGSRGIVLLAVLAAVLAAFAVAQALVVRSRDTEASG